MRLGETHLWKTQRDAVRSITNTYSLIVPVSCQLAGGHARMEEETLVRSLLCLPIRQLAQLFSYYWLTIYKMAAVDGSVSGFVRIFH